MSWIETGKIRSILVYSTPETVRKFWTGLPNFEKFGTGVWVAVTKPSTASY